MEKRPDLDVDAWLADQDDPTLTALDADIRTAMPGCSRQVWTGRFWGGTDQQIVGYGDLVQPRPRGPGVEWFVVGLARQRRHYSLYVNAVEDGRYLGQHYAERLGRVRAGSASLGFGSREALDLAVLDEMLRHAHRLTAG